MPGKFEIMRAVRKGLDGLVVDRRASNTEWTKAIKTKLCKIGTDEFRCKVGAHGVDEPEPDYREWLYDVTWLEYATDGPLIDAHLVAECEWGNLGEIGDDFEKLLLARASMRLMIFDGNYECDGCEPGSRRIAEHLAKCAKEFNGSRAEDAWLLAAWEKKGEDGWSFSYFTIETNTAIVHSFS